MHASTLDLEPGRRKASAGFWYERCGGADTLPDIGGRRE